jgi:hypothetical protein
VPLFVAAMAAGRSTSLMCRTFAQGWSVLSSGQPVGTARRTRAFWSPSALYKASACGPLLKALAREAIPCLYRTAAVVALVGLIDDDHVERRGRRFVQRESVGAGAQQANREQRTNELVFLVHGRHSQRDSLVFVVQPAA